MQPNSPLSQTPTSDANLPIGTLPGVQPMAATPAPPQQPVAATQPTQPTQPNPVSDSGAPAMADDGDLIEIEWVAKVKQVVRATAHDPYEQNLQFTKLKADYMQKRYGKSIKLD
jgi:hypothetical protein